MKEVDEEIVGIIIELPVSWYELPVIMNYRLVNIKLPVGQYELPVSWYELPVNMNYQLVQKYWLISIELPVGMELPIVLAIDREQPDVG